MTAPNLIIPKHSKLGKGYHIRDMVRESPGRQVNPEKGYQSPAVFLDDLVQLKQAIILCSFCVVKWNPHKNKYRARYIPDPSGVTSGYAVQGKCDACKQMTGNMGGGKVYINMDDWAKVSIDPATARRRAREVWMQGQSMKVWASAATDVRKNPRKYGLKITDRRRVK